MRHEKYSYFPSSIKSSSKEKQKEKQKEKEEAIHKLTLEIPSISPQLASTTMVPHFSKTNKNVGIIFWYLPTTKHTNATPKSRQIEILTGIETCYLTDKVTPEIQPLIRNYQIYSTAPSPPLSHNPKIFPQMPENQHIHEIFSKRAKILSKELKQTIYFDNPIQYPNEPNLWQTQYRVISESAKRGILKGSMEEAETQEQAIQREIQEELFPFLDKDQIPLQSNKIQALPNPIKLNQDSLYTFHYRLDEEEKMLIEQNIQRLQEDKYGELVHYAFRPMTEIFSSPQSTHPNYHLLKQYLNGKSRLYLKEFYQSFSSIFTSIPSNAPLPSPSIPSIHK